MVTIKTAVFYQYLLASPANLYSGDIFYLLDWLVYSNREEREAARGYNVSLLPFLVEEIFQLKKIADTKELYTLVEKVGIIQVYLSLEEQLELAEFIAAKRLELITGELL